MLQTMLLLILVVQVLIKTTRVLWMKKKYKKLFLMRNIWSTWRVDKRKRQTSMTITSQGSKFQAKQDPRNKNRFNVCSISVSKVI